MVCKATVKKEEVNNNYEKLYNSAAELNWKNRRYNHNLNFTICPQYNTIQKYGKLEETGESPIIKWGIVKKAQTYKVDNSCRLCLQIK